MRELNTIKIIAVDHDTATSRLPIQLPLPECPPMKQSQFSPETF